jgi:ATP/maltotriose-dependent transcriptional regulator MalT
MGFDVTREPAGEVDDHVTQAIRTFAEARDFTERETEFLHLIVGEGLSTRAIAQRLEVSKATVKWHLHNILCKAGAARQGQLLRRVLGLPCVDTCVSEAGETCSAPCSDVPRYL